MKGFFCLFLLLSIGLSTSCKKKHALKIDAQFKNNWKHNIDESLSEILQMGHGNSGYREKYENGQIKSDTQPRKWLIKYDRLYFGWAAGKGDQFSIDLYPTIATTAIISDFDTINTGDKYIILDGNYYRGLK